MIDTIIAKTQSFVNANIKEGDENDNSGYSFIGHMYTLAEVSGVMSAIKTDYK